MSQIYMFKMNFHVESYVFLGEHRLIYQVNDTTITVSVLSAFGHYGDK